MEEEREIHFTVEQKNKLEALKKVHGIVQVIQIPDSEGNLHTAFLKKPQRHTLSFYLAKVANDPIVAHEVLLDACWIEGDTEIKSNDDLFLSAIPLLGGMIQLRQGFLKKF
jgi:hypothetical protein